MITSETRYKSKLKGINFTLFFWTGSMCVELESLPSLYGWICATLYCLLCAHKIYTCIKYLWLQLCSWFRRSPSFSSPRPHSLLPPGGMVCHKKLMCTCAGGTTRAVIFPARLGQRGRSAVRERGTDLPIQNGPSGPSLRWWRSLVPGNKCEPTC